LKTNDLQYEKSNKLKQFFLLARPINLFIIGFTMYSIRFFLERQSFIQLGKQGQSFEQVDFFILCISSLFMGAAGNIINDYFDIQTDKINKPHRLIITKYISPKLALIVYWILNLLAISCSSYLSIRHETPVYFVIYTFTITLLWLYSKKLKRTFLLGNTAIAFLTSGVPLLVCMYYFSLAQLNSSSTVLIELKYELISLQHDIYRIPQIEIVFSIGVLLAVFAFFSNLAREVIKDAEDVKGDLIIHAKTIPLVLGISTATRIIGCLLALPTLLFCLYFMTAPWKNSGFQLLVFAPITLALLIQLSALSILLYRQQKTNFKTIHLLLKVSMFVGLFTPLYLTYF
jgi:4-hydroxybenzoate polyprenyltransferase